MTGQWINQYPNLYAIFSAAGPTGNGTIAQIKESYQSGRILWAIGVDSDQYIEGLMPDGHSVVLTSAMKMPMLLFTVRSSISNAISSTMGKQYTIWIMMEWASAKATPSRYRRIFFSKLKRLKSKFAIETLPYTPPYHRCKSRSYCQLHHRRQGRLVIASIDKVYSYIVAQDNGYSQTHSGESSPCHGASRRCAQLSLNTT